MNTLQLYISKSSHDNVRLAEINPTDEGRRAAADMRTAVSLIDYAPSAKIVFFIVTNLSGGYAIHVIRTIPPTRPNHLDATIYVDKNLDIMAEDLEEVLSRVSDIVLAKAVTQTEMDELNRMFGREYDLRDKAPRIKASRGKDYAFLSYGKASGRSLADIIGEEIYRPDWSGYKAVVLLDDSVIPFQNSMVDLSLTYVEEPRYEDDSTESTDSDTYKESDKTSGKRSDQLTYIFALPISTPDGRTSLEFEIESSKPILRSPVAGYKTVGKPVAGSDNSNKLRLSERRSIGKWIWGAAGFVTGIILMLLLGHGCSDADAPAASADKPHAETASVTDSPEFQPTEASVYLDNNRIWQRDDMEKIDALKGLFDDLNNYRFDIITEKWAPQLSSSKNFSKIVKAASDAINKKVDPRRDDNHNPTYNRDGDTAISWRGYTYWIDP